MKDKNQLISWGKFFIGWPLSVISFIFLFKIVFQQGSRLNIDFKYLDLRVLVLGILTFFLYFLLRSFLWRESLKFNKNKVKFLESTYRFSISEIKRYTPGNVWSFISRVTLFKEIGVDVKTVGTAILADIQLVIIGCGLVSLFALNWILNSPDELRTKLLSLLPVSLVLIAVYFIVTGTIFKRKYKGEGSLVSNLILPGYDLKDKIKLILIAAITYAVFGVANYLVFLSLFNLDPTYLIILPAFFTFALLVGYLTFITPTGLGVRELVVTLGLSQLMNTNDAGAMSIYTRIILILSEFSFLLIIFLWKNLSKK